MRFVVPVERQDCPRCDGRGELFFGGDLVECDYPGCYCGVLNAEELGWPRPTQYEEKE